MKHSIFYLIYIFLMAGIMAGCGFAEEMTDRAADSPEGMEKAYVINLDNTEAGTAREVWNQLIREHKSRVMRIKGSSVQLANNVVITGLPSDLTVKSLFEQKGEQTEMRLWFVDGTEYMTPRSNPGAYDNIDRFIDTYFTALETKQIQNEVEQEEARLAELEKELEKLRRDNKKLHSTITKAEQEIKDARIKIEENLHAQDQMAEKIQEQRNVIHQTQSQLSGVRD
ncbi:hypothetical protein KUV50_06800 [Membranicola marinus]|uniref:Uncharacterized protein n=1 Tax=Membranihabitans marinus TaxID=1227546 RepID=A0A953HSY8_9BACT|nr:hypothetical protein [Membranihabitans marinus]MBY5957830.1 hypothetical protein [Membranihabitans marinus]